MKISEAQKFVKKFTIDNNWDDSPNIDKFDHLHEELIEMSKLLRYKNSSQMKEILEKDKDKFEDGIGDLLFATLRLSNQLNVDAEVSFNFVKDKIVQRYYNKKENEGHQK